MMFAGHYTQ